MSKINLLIANSSGSLSGHIAVLKRATSRAEKFIFNKLGVNWDIDVVMTDQVYDSTIPEDGVCGRAFSSSFIMFYVDPAVMTETKIYEMLCHELSHAARWGKNPEYSKNLFDNLILEGLAMVVEEAALTEIDKEKQTFCLSVVQKQDKEMFQKLYQKTAPLFLYAHSDYDFHEIFISGNDELPRWSGYTLGYGLVKRFLNKTGKTIFEANALPYTDFRKASIEKAPL